MKSLQIWFLRDRLLNHFQDFYFQYPIFLVKMISPKSQKLQKASKLWWGFLGFCGGFGGFWIWWEGLWFFVRLDFESIFRDFNKKYKLLKI